MQYDSNFHHRRSIRLKTYDYSSMGAYFVTICAYKKECLFGEIKNGEMRINKVGMIVQQWWKKLPNKFSNLQTDECVIMPNHIHGIIFIVRADPCVCPGPVVAPGRSVDPGPVVAPGRSVDPGHGSRDQGAHMGAPLPKMIQWFKTMTTNEYIRYQKKINPNQVVPKLWHHNYYERVIRCDAELYNVRKYIFDNPLNWNTDPERN
ncbi:hypothetical protein EXS71_03680 [Candidatus Uhrbacteria bacterium]|nr:hypothetical protein [Candidatus Uhrbacteria bacterium]